MSQRSQRRSTPIRVLGISVASLIAFAGGWFVGGVGMIVWASWHVMGEKGFRK